MKNILVISGGSGNDALLKGIFHYYEKAKVKVLVNAYDDGKSTGVCREITNTLGVSDIRKNHYRMYSIKHQKNINDSIKSFYNERFDLKKGEELSFVIGKLNSWNLSFMIKYARSFFEQQHNHEFNDFSIANIIYSQMFKEVGYEQTNKMMCELLNIDDFVIMNSFENVTIGAVTNNGTIKDESGIVDFSSNVDKIKSITYQSESPIVLNSKAIEAIMNSDMIIISTGTFWSSIYPTLEYGQLYKVINMASGKKMWVMNNEEDKDSLGVGSNEFIRIVEQMGLNLKDFLIIENKDAVESLRQKNSDFNIVYHAMGNTNGRHNPMEIGYVILSEYYGIDANKFDNILIDFDNTIYNANECFEITEDNIIEIAKNKSISIVSGNDYNTHIEPILKKVFGHKINIFANKVWADASSILYAMGDIVSYINNNVISEDIIDVIDKYISSKIGMHGHVNNKEYITCYKIKPLSDVDRNLLCELLNGYVFKELDINKYVKAIKAGRTTIDIVAIDNDKKQVLNEHEFGSTLYIGDELMDYGNDYAIARCCTKSIQVEDVYETNMILKLLNKK